MSAVEWDLVREHMLHVFDSHFRPALRGLSPTALNILINGLEPTPSNLDRDTLRQELVEFVRRITNSRAAELGMASEEDTPRPKRRRVEE